MVTHTSFFTMLTLATKSTQQQEEHKHKQHNNRHTQESNTHQSCRGFGACTDISCKSSNTRCRGRRCSRGSPPRPVSAQGGGLYRNGIGPREVVDGWRLVKDFKTRDNLIISVSFSVTFTVHHHHCQIRNSWIVQLENRWELEAVKSPL